MGELEDQTQHATRVSMSPTTAIAHRIQQRGSEGLSCSDDNNDESIRRGVPHGRSVMIGHDSAKEIANSTR